MSAADEGWARYKSRHVHEHTLVNCEAWPSRPCANRFGRWLHGRPAFVVGAGPSLQQHAAILPDMAKRGAVLAVNASSGPLEAHGVTPDVLVARESLDCSPEIAASKARTVVLDVGAHPRAYEAAGDRVAWYMPGYTRHFDLCRMLGIEPLFTGTAAITAAVRMALRWGASPVVLVGVDLAYASDGRAYHPSALRGASRAEVTGGRVKITSDDAAIEREHSSGQPGFARELDAHPLPGWHGGEVSSICTWVDQWQWLRDIAENEGTTVTLINATEGGAAIPGWACTPLSDVLATLPEAPTPAAPTTTVDAERAEWAITKLRDEADVLESLCGAVLRDGGPDLASVAAIAGLHAGAPFVEGMALADLAEANEIFPAGGERITYAYAAKQAGARRVKEVLSE